MKHPTKNTVPLTDAALRLRIGYAGALHRLLTGRLRGGRDEKGGWVVDVDSLEAAVRKQEGADTAERVVA